MHAGYDGDTLESENTMRPCEFCSDPWMRRPTPAPAAARQSTWPTPPAGQASSASSPTKTSALWLGDLHPVAQRYRAIWIGSKANKTAWMIEGAIYMLPFIVFMFSSSDEPSDAVTGWAMLFWVVAIFRALKLKNEYNAIMISRPR